MADDRWAGGFIPIMRALADTPPHPIRRDPIALAMYLELLFRARYRQGIERSASRRTFVDCAVGEAVFGRAELAKQLRVSERAIRRAGKLLETCHLVGIKTGRHGSVATLCGYADFWNLEAAERPASGQRAASERPASDPVTDHSDHRDHSSSTPSQELQVGLFGPSTAAANTSSAQRPEKRSRRATTAPPPLPWTIKQLGEAFARGAGRAFAIDSWDQGLAKPLTGLIRQLSEQTRTLVDVESAGRVVAGWRLAEPVAWAWLAKAGNLVGAIAKAQTAPGVRQLTAADEGFTRVLR